MPKYKQKPRIALTVPDDLNKLLDELADYQKVPKTKIILDFLIAVQPHLESMLGAFKAIDKDKANALDVVKSFGDESVLLATRGTADLAESVHKFKSKSQQ